MGGSGSCKSMALSCRRAKQRLNNAVAASSVGRYFKLEGRNTTFTTELRAGTATFLTMAYIISVNAAILSDSGATCTARICGESSPGCGLRPDKEYRACLAEVRSDLMVATVLVSMVGSLAMGLLANLPLALAPGMGANAFFTYNLVGFRGTGSVAYSTALAVVLTEGCLFLLLSAVGLRSRLARLIPRPIRLASAAGVGLFLAFVGLQSQNGLGLVGPSKATLVTLAACSKTNAITGECIAGTTMRSPTFWLGAAGFLVTALCMGKRIRGGIIYGIVLVTVVSWVRGTPVTAFPDTPAGDAAHAYFSKVVDFHKIKTTAGAVSFTGFNRGEVWLALLTLLYVDLLDTTANIYSLAELAGFVDSNTGRFEGEYPAFMVDTGSTIIGAALGSSTVTTYVESAAGIEEGGRTGMTAVTVGFCFLVSLFFAPLLTSVPPWAVGSALVAVGAMMVRAVKGIDWGEPKESVPAFVTMALMPLTYSIANGVVAGIAVYIVIRVYEYVCVAIRWVGKARRVRREGTNQVSAATGGGGGDADIVPPPATAV